MGRQSSRLLRGLQALGWSAAGVFSERDLAGNATKAGALMHRSRPERTQTVSDGWEHEREEFLPCQ